MPDVQIDEPARECVVELATDDAGVAQLLDQLVANKVRLISFGEKEPSLEDVFMMVTKGLVM